MARKDADKGAKARKAHNMAAALEYKKAGATERFIAERLGVNQSTVNRYIAEALEELKERGLQSAEEMRTLEGARIDQARFAIASKVVRGELNALDRWIKASESYRKLYGLDAKDDAAVKVLERMAKSIDFSSLNDEQLQRLVAGDVEGVLFSGAKSDDSAVGDSEPDSDSGAGGT